MLFDRGSAGRKYLMTGLCTTISWCVFATFILVWHGGAIERLGYKVYDLKLSFFAKSQENPNIVHIDVDDHAIEEFGQWPWDRSISARIASKLKGLGARAVVFDILYTTRGRSVEGDEALFKATAEGGMVVHAFSPIELGFDVPVIKGSADRARAELLYDRAWRGMSLSGFKLWEIKELRNSGLPLPQILQAAASLGHVKACSDSDGGYRRIPLVLRWADRVLPSLSLAALAVSLRVSPDDIELNPEGWIELKHRHGIRRIPVDRQANLCINWRPIWSSFPHYSVSDLFTEEPDSRKAPRYKGKIVIVGVTWTGSADLGLNPLGEELPLNRIHSAALDTLLSGRFIREVQPHGMVVLSLLAVGILCYLAIVKVSLKPTLLFTLGFIALLAACVFPAFFFYRLEIPFVQPVFVFLPAAVLVLACRAISNEKEREIIQDIFGRYLSREVVDEILKSPDGFSLTGELREMTILVSDLRDFTHMAGSLPPAVTLKVINRYLERMTDIVLKHQGTINEVLGDGMLVFFGAPRKLPDAPKRAVACGLEMQAAMADLNRGNADLGLPELQMGIGIHRGELVVGNIGSERRRKYGAVGNAINVAFRVVAKSKGGEVLVTDDVYQKYAHALDVRSPRQVRLKGIDTDMTLYRVDSVQLV